MLRILSLRKTMFKNVIFNNVITLFHGFMNNKLKHG